MNHPTRPRNVPPPARCSRTASPRGIVLIEALVGIMIFAFGLLGMVGLQAAMTQAQTASRYRADASNLANELLGKMWSDTPANLPSYATGQCASYGHCADWLAKVQAALPAGGATITVTEVPAGTLAIYNTAIHVSWSQPGQQGAHRQVLEAQVQPLP